MQRPFGQIESDRQLPLGVQRVRRFGSDDREDADRGQVLTSGLDDLGAELFALVQQQSLAHEGLIHILQSAKADWTNVGFWTYFGLELDIQLVLIRPQRGDRHGNFSQRISVGAQRIPQSPLRGKHLRSQSRLTWLESELRGNIRRDRGRNRDLTELEARA